MFCPIFYLNALDINSDRGIIVKRNDYCLNKNVKNGRRGGWHEKKYCSGMC